MIQNKVKLVVWDLDETFWRGTLAEEGMTPVAGNAEKIVELSKRGIINSICSKNDYQRAKAKLVELGVWEYFVFPAISFDPKGKVVAEMIEGAALRAENVLFLDDNPMNLEEVKYFNPGIMVAHPKDVLDGLLDHPHLAGKPDPELTRLKQYQFLQRKVEERSGSAVSNEEFLRLSNIRVTIDYDVEANFDRVVELINRTNQLNYTKKRLEDPKLVARFRESLTAFGNNSGCVWVSDNYGDYGLVGFFQMRRRTAWKKLIHFVFSCRTMNMGIEQYVYELLDRPDLEVVGPVSYGVETHDRIDWINAHEQATEEPGAKGAKLLLLGGCDLLQLANYCSTNRLEFVNRAKGDVTVRYDDIGFILSDREALRENSALLPTWSYEDALKFDDAVATSKLILLCMYGAVQGTYFELNGSVRLRLAKDLAEMRQDRDPLADKVRELDLDLNQRIDLIKECCEAVVHRARDDAQIFVIGYSTLGTPSARKVAKRKTVNDALKAFCESHPRFRFVDVDVLVPRKELVDQRHFSPAGYFMIARHILGLSGVSGPALHVDKAKSGNAIALDPKAAATAAS